MKKLTFISVLLCCSLWGLAQPAPQPELSLDTRKVLIHENIKLYPIRASQPYIEEHRHLGNYIPLKEALTKKQVMITEKGAPTQNGTQQGGTRQRRISSDESSVNNLYIENKGKDTVFLMAGDVLQGGKQDRIVARDTLLAPGSGKVNIGVFCVEQHRWTPQKEDGKVSYSFGNVSGVATKSVRKAATKSKEQTKVWEEVKKVSEANNVSSSTGTYNALDSSPDFANKKKAYVNDLKEGFGNDPAIVGMVVASGDSVLGTEIFYNAELFRKQYPALLESYVTEAVSYGKKVAISDQAVLIHFQGSNSAYRNRKGSQDGKFLHKDKVVHYTD